jgi:hypothetical protein
LSDLTWLQFTTDFATSGGVSTLVYGTTAFVTTATCSAFAAPAAVVVVSGIGAAVVGGYGYQYAMDEVREHFYERPMDPIAEQAGHLIGSFAGGYIGAEAGAVVGQVIRWHWTYPTYATYEKEARRLTEIAYRQNKDIIDPGRLRSRDWHLDHEKSIKEGWLRRLPPEEVAAVENLRMLPGPINTGEGPRLPPGLTGPMWPPPYKVFPAKMESYTVHSLLPG